jgi:protein ImuB
MKRILYIRGPAPAIPALGEACFSLTPKVSVSSENEIFLEVGGTQRALGGEARTLMLADGLVTTFGLGDGAARVLTDRPEWARALAPVSGEVILAPGRSQERLFALPIGRLVHCGDPAVIPEELREREALVRFMKRVGMPFIRDFAGLPPAAVLRRFGKMGLTLQEWVLGKRELILPPFTPEEKIREWVDTDEITSLDSLLLNLHDVLARIEARLQGRGRLAKRLLFTFNLESHAPLVKPFELSEPCRETKQLLRLSAEFLNGVRWESPLVRLEIEVADTLPWQPGQLSLFDEVENRFYDLAQYVARLRTRFGESSVGFPGLRESYLPERSWQPCFPPEKAPPPRNPYPERPLFLFNPPRRCSPPRHWHLIPSENLVTEWWEGTGGNRHYFIARDPKGECLWVYRDDRSGEWFLHGTFD